MRERWNEFDLRATCMGHAPLTGREPAKQMITHLLRCKIHYGSKGTIACEALKRPSAHSGGMKHRQINAPERDVFGIIITGPNAPAWATYMFCLIFLTFCAIMARNLTRGTQGRTWMAIRDMDIAAEIIGVNPLKAKMTAFAVSGFFVGISGALFFSVYLGAVEVGEAFGINKSFLVLFMVIIGGLGSIFGSFAGAAFLVLLPVILKVVGVDWLGWPTDIVAHFQLVIVGALIITFLILEPHGLAQLWRVAKEKLRLWPFPH